MKRQTRINGEYIEGLKWTLKLTMGELNTRLSKMGKGGNYIYRLKGEGRQNVTLNTIDAIYNVLVDRFNELGLPVPQDLWANLLTYDWVEDEEKAEDTISE